jgi:hypothetical protein
MTPQETQLVSDLFDRLAGIESAPRDAAAEQVIADGLRRAPHAVYALVQTALVQDEALKRANARIEELQAQMTSVEAEEQRPASFLDTMREAVTGRAAARGSVPSVRPPTRGTQPENLQSHESQSQSFQPQPGSAPPSPAGYPGSAPFAPGGSFLGNAASTAAGVIGGSLLLNSIRSAFGQHAAGAGPSKGVAGGSPLPWSNKADAGAGAAATDHARDSGARKASDQADDAQDEKHDNVESVADTDEDYDHDDADDMDEEDFDDEDADDDSYDV